MSSTKLLTKIEHFRSLLQEIISDKFVFFITREVLHNNQDLYQTLSRDLTINAIINSLYYVRDVNTEIKSFVDQHLIPLQNDLGEFIPTVALAFILKNHTFPYAREYIENLIDSNHIQNVRDVAVIDFGKVCHTEQTKLIHDEIKTFGRIVDWNKMLIEIIDAYNLRGGCMFILSGLAGDKIEARLKQLLPSAITSDPLNKIRFIKRSIKMEPEL